MNELKQLNDIILSDQSFETKASLVRDWLQDNAIKGDIIAIKEDDGKFYDYTCVSWGVRAGIEWEAYLPPTLAPETNGVVATSQMNYWLLKKEFIVKKLNGNSIQKNEPSNRIVTEGNDNKQLLYEIENEVYYQFKLQDSKPVYVDKPHQLKDRIQFTLRLDSYSSSHIKLAPIKKALSKFGPVKQSTFKHPRLTHGDKEITYQIGTIEDMNENLNQYYGINDVGKTVYVAMSEKEIEDYAKKHPEENIVRVEDKFGNGYNLKESYPIQESFKMWDKKEFNDNSNTYELEMLYESVKTTLSAQQKNDLARFVRKAKTAEEINTYMTGILAQGSMNEAFDKPPHEFWYYTKHGLGPGTIPKDVNILDVKEDDNWGTYIKLDKVLTTDELNKYEIKEKIPPNELTEEVDEESFNKLKEIAYELDDYIEDKVWVRDFWYDGQFDNTITFSISGDWKHDHARFDYYASEWLDNKGLDYKISQHITDDDGSDSYEADHTIRIYNLKDNLEEDISSKDIQKTKYAADAFVLVLNNLSNKLDGYEEFGDGEFDISYQGSKRELQREIIDTFAKADIELKREHNALVYSIPNNYDAYIYIAKDDEASTYTENSVGYYARVETVL